MFAMGNRGDIVKRIGYRIRRMRDLAGLTQAELATKAGLSRSFLTRVEAGTAEASLSSLANIASALDVSVAQIVGDATISPRPETAAMQLLQAAVKATQGVPIRYAGTVPGGDESRGTATGGRMLNVPADWTTGRDLESLFVLEVDDESFAGNGIASGSFVMCEPPVARDLSNGDVVVIRVGRMLSLRRWSKLATLIERRDDDDRTLVRLSTGELATVIGVVLESWRRWHP